MSSTVSTVRYQGAQQCPVSLGFKARSGVQYNTWSKLEAVSSILLGVTARSDQYHSVSQRAASLSFISRHSWRQSLSKTLQSLFDRSVSVWWLVRYAAARRSKGYIVPGVPYWEHTVRGNTHTVPAPGSQLHRPMTIVTGCGAITSNTINASRLYSPCTAYAGTSTTEVRFALI